MKVNPKRVEADYALILAAALAGERCPQNKPFGPLHERSIPTLITAGRIQSEVYRHNWRVAVILEGEHRGRRTKPCPMQGAAPYMINGRRRIGRL